MNKDPTSFALTEPKYGSDATGLETTAERVSGGYILNGEKRWIGNATHAKVIIIFARETEKKVLKGFLVKNPSKGLTCKKIEGKMALRSVQNADIWLKNVFVRDTEVLPFNGWSNGPGKVLTHS